VDAPGDPFAESMMRVAVVQFSPRFGEVDANLRRTEELIQGLDAEVVVLPELFQTGYLFTRREELPRLAEPLDGPTRDLVTSWARDLDAAIVYGFAEATPQGCFNSAALVGPEGLLSHYRKIHLFDREKLWFEPGTMGFSVIEFRGVRMGIMVCFDWRFPEAARSLAFLGADLIVHPSNLVLPWCPDAMITRALENNVFIATSDRWGVEAKDGVELRFSGRSQVVSPRGERLATLGEAEDGVIVVDIDPALARDKQVTEHNHLYGDRSPALYVGTPLEH